MKRSHLLLALIAMLVVGISLSACSSKKMMQLDAPMKQAEHTA
jgi:hypothetical protein